jgi:gliding motility-associated-like protein
VAGYRWTDSQGNNKGIGPSITGLPQGSYSLYLTDKNGCESFYKSYTIYNVAPVSIKTGSGTVTNDQCNVKAGGVTGIQVTEGVQPYSYNWTDNSGNSVSTNLDLSGVGAGNYTLTVTDASGCTPATQSFTIQNTDSTVPTPSVDNVQVCSSGSMLITVNNPSSAAVYNLYTDAGSTTPAQQSTGGKFRVDVSSNTSFYITQISGTCESSKAKIDVSVGLSALNIANTFTPNGDGINDYWKINNIENYPQALVQVFTRDGQKIFESKGYTVPFDGTYKGQKLPSGVYYFIINLNANCSLLSGSLTILR